MHGPLNLFDGDVYKSQVTDVTHTYHMFLLYKLSGSTFGKLNFVAADRSNPYRRHPNDINDVVPKALLEEVRGNVSTFLDGVKCQVDYWFATCGGPGKWADAITAAAKVTNNCHLLVAGKAEVTGDDRLGGAAPEHPDGIGSESDE